MRRQCLIFFLNVNINFYRKKLFQNFILPSLMIILLMWICQVIKTMSMSWRNWVLYHYFDFNIYNINWNIIENSQLNSFQKCKYFFSHSITWNMFMIKYLKDIFEQTVKKFFTIEHAYFSCFFAVFTFYCWFNVSDFLDGIFNNTC